MLSRPKLVAELIRGCCVLALGLAAAWPFFTTGLVSSGDGYNYSLSVADAVTQARAGEFPALVGQSRFAFNGRVHPLRTAPYLHFLAVGIDTLTEHALSLWEIQNVSLALSLLVAAFACYGGLRWSSGCAPNLAVLLSGLYILSPPVLAAAFSFDLFMTVHAAAFLPVAVAGCLRACRLPSLCADVVMAAGLAALWLAHPPVALWASVGVVLVRGTYQVGFGSWRSLGSLVTSAFLFILLAGFGFFSVVSLGVAGESALGVEAGPADRALAHDIVRTVSSAYPAALAPISARADQLGDVQAGYAAWLLLGATVVSLAAGIRSSAVRRSGRFWACLVVVLFVGSLYVLDLPVGSMTAALWPRLPRPFIDLTNVWPMYRLYLVAVVFLVFGAAVASGWLAEPSPCHRKVGWILGVAALAWTAFEARPFLHRAMSGRTAEAEVRRSQRPSNLDLSVISYSLVGAPTNYTVGVIDPEFAFRLVRPGSPESVSNFDATRAGSATVGTWPLITEPGKGGASWSLPAPLQLQPGRRYLLTFSDDPGALAATLVLRGTQLQRVYGLDGRGGAAGFGFGPGQNRSLVLWTDLGQPETVEVRVFVDPAARPVRRLGAVTLQEVSNAALPVRLRSLSPLTFDVTTPGPGYAVITPRLFVPGYAVQVDGRSVQPVESDDFQLAVPVPAGRAHVVVRYPGPAGLVATFWIGLAAWTAVIVLLIGPPPAPLLRPALQRLGASLWERRLAVAGYLAIAAAATALVVLVRPREPQRAGPAQVTFRLPWGEWGRTQPLLTTGHATAGTVISVTYLDSSHIRLNADVWGFDVHSSRALACDYTQVQSLVVSDSALYPPNDPAFRRLAPLTQQALRSTLTVMLNGERVLDVPLDAYDTRPKEIGWGIAPYWNGPDRRFGGTILSQGRLPMPDVRVGHDAQLRVRFSRDVGRSEPILYAHSVASEATLVADRLSDRRVRLTVIDATGRRSAATVFADPDGREHTVQFSLGVPRAGAEPAWSLQLDDAAPVGSARGALTPTYFVAGLNEGAAAGVQPHFLGRQLEFAREPVPFRPEDDGTGPVDLLVRFPTRPGRQEPLVVTGEPGRGDLVYVVYEGDSHVRFGFDHWAVSGALSEPIAVSYGAIHALRISLGSLYPTNGSGREALRPWTVELDGRTVLSRTLGSYPAGPGGVHLGTNPIGGSTCDPQFCGDLLLARREAAAAPDR